MRDPRQLRTRTALTETLLRLLDEESLENISISRLCAAAGVHRTTFYKHARSIEEFAVGVIMGDLDNTARQPQPGADPVEHYRLAMIQILRHVAAERQLYRPLLASSLGGALRFAIDERMQPRVRKALDYFAAEAAAEIPEDRDEAVAYISGGLVGAIAHWALCDDLDAESQAARIHALMPQWWPVR